MAETIVPYLAVRCRTERVTEGLEYTVPSAIPDRAEYLDGRQLDTHPLSQP